MFTKPDNDGEGYYVIGYYDVGGGVIFYDYMYVPSLYEAELAAFAIAGIIMLVGTDGAAALGPAFATAFAH